MMLSLPLWWAPLIVILAVARLFGVRTNAVWLLIAVAMQAAYVAAIAAGGGLLDLESRFGPLQWNWGGKIAAILLTLAMFCALWIATKSMTREAAGFVLRQRPGSFAPALTAAAILIALTIALELLVADGRDTSAERLLFQATMPGLDEEPFFRGLLLAALCFAAPTRGISFFGASVTMGGVLSTLLFGLMHGAAYSGGAIAFDAPVTIVVAFIGFGLYWIRARTGSVLLPILAHNAVNFSSSFF